MVVLAVHEIAIGLAHIANGITVHEAGPRIIIRKDRHPVLVIHRYQAIG